MIKTTIVCFGDSLTYGYGVDINVGYVDRLEKYMPQYYPSIAWNIVNSGINGDTTREGLKRLQKDVLKYNPNIVIILFGSNDSCLMEGQYRTPHEFENNLNEIILKIKNHNNRTGLNHCIPIPVLLTPPPIEDVDFMPFNKNNRIEKYCQIIKEVSQKHKCLFADFHKYMLEETNENYMDCLQYDGLHLNRKGYDLLYDCIFSSITKLINYEGILKDFDDI